MISILIPVHNRALFIGACVESALAQTYPDFEIVIVDNASTDSTWEICQSLSARDKRIRTFRNESNIGPVRNWKRCIDEARGETGKILFSDDLIAPSFLEKTVPFLDDPSVGLVLTAANVDGRIEYLLSGRSGKLPRWTCLRHMMFNGRLPVSPGAALFRMADLRRNLFVDFGHNGIGPDLLLLLLTAASRPFVAHVAEPLAIFHDHEGSISRQHKSQLTRGYASARLWFWLFSIARLIHT
ncbi:MAG TPA: glycosyltransferase family 2 protein [Bryobacteraceae bacterium]|jgi:glycosyltransferase involved in cell wall biosynthesis|nr:glycosyltransferase family 2 protein [Bryobacteraceae bacterium]